MSSRTTLLQPPDGVDFADDMSTMRKELAKMQMAQAQHLSRESGILSEIKRLISAEREARLQETAELRQLIEHIRATCQGAITEEVLTDVVSQELLREQEARCQRDAELCAKLQRESATLMSRLEAHCALVDQEFSGIQSLVNEQIAAISRAVVDEQEERNKETMELRAILDGVWRTVSDRPSSEMNERRFFKMGDRYKNVVGDQDDINTLYDMVREAMGDQVRLSSELADERALRGTISDDLDRLKLSVRQMWDSDSQKDCTCVEPRSFEYSRGKGLAWASPNESVSGANWSGAAPAPGGIEGRAP